MALKKLRVATSGTTIDGREIPAAHLVSIAKNYDPKTYNARINLEHIPGVTAEPPFNSYGDVISCEVREETLNFGGKAEKRTTLHVEIDANDQLVDVNKKGQKLYSSIEYYNNFNGAADEFYLAGLAITDTPASFGTERMKFSTTPVEVAGKFSSEATEVAFEDIATAATAAIDVPQDGFFKAMTNFFTQFTPKTEPKPATGDQGSLGIDMPAFAAAFQSGLTEMQNAFTKALEANATKIEALSAEVKAAQAKFDAAPAANHTPRPLSTGADTQIKARC